MVRPSTGWQFVAFSCASRVRSLFMTGAASARFGKLFHLREWVELKDAARYLTIMVGEETGPDDVLRLGLDGHLTLSVRFVTAATALCGKRIPSDEAKRHVVPALDGNGFLSWIEGTILHNQREVIVFEDQISILTEVWDLPLLESDRLEVEELYERIQGREPELFNLEGFFVRRGDVYAKLMSRFNKTDVQLLQPYDNPRNYYPAERLPSDAVIVVRTDALRQFTSQLTVVGESPSERTLQRRERTTLLTIVAALARMAKLDLAKPSKAAAASESETTRMGSRVAARTIENHIKAIREFVEELP
jgi:hypothetical protein